MRASGSMFGGYRTDRAPLNPHIKALTVGLGARVEAGEIPRRLFVMVVGFHF